MSKAGRHRTWRERKGSRARGQVHFLRRPDSNSRTDTEPLLRKLTGSKFKYVISRKRKLLRK